MKWIKRIVLAVVLLIAVGVCIVYFSLNSILRSVIQREATASLGVPTTLGSAHLSILGGKIDLENLDVNSPPKFSAPNMFTLAGIAVTVHYGQLTAAPIHIQRIVIDQPVLVIEQANIQLNLDALMHQSPQPQPTNSGQPGQPIKLVIDELDLNNAQVTFMPGIPGLADSFQVPIASMTLKDIGNADGNQTGAAINQVILQTTTALAGKAVADSKLPPAVKLVLSQELAAISSQLGTGFDAQFKNLAGAISGSLTKQLTPKLQNTVDQLLKGSK